jgi:hypothetical protein
MEPTIDERLRLLRQNLPDCCFQVVTTREVPSERWAEHATVTEKIVISEYPYSPAFFTSEVSVVSFSECERVFFTLRIEYVDPRDMDGLFAGLPPSELRENFLTEGGAIEDVYDFWRLSLDDLGFNEVKLRDYLEIDIQEENPTGKFVLRFEFTLQLKTFEEVLNVLSRINEMWRQHPLSHE